jgi:diacylglycerol kinase (ATP)
MLSGIHDALIIYNPTSGGGTHRRLEEVERAARILAEAGIQAELAPTKARSSATALARLAVKGGRQLVIACGGDGTVNEIVNGLAGSQVPLAVLPAGTANVLAKELRIPWNIPAAAKLIPAGTLRRIALGAASGLNAGGEGESTRYFLCIGGAGPDGAMVHALENADQQKTGIVEYWLEGFRQLFTYKFPEIQIQSDGHELRGTIIVAGRTKHYGGPFRITTEASLFEDSFEVMAYTSRSRFRYLLCMPALWLGQLRHMHGVHFWKATEVFCEAAGGETIYAQVDGEPLGMLPLKFHVVPDALTLVIPPGVSVPGT